MPAKKHKKSVVKLMHPRHSFSLVHHRHTSHPLLLFVLLLSGIFSAGWTTYASGATDSYVVHARLPAPALTQGATISNPATTYKNQIMTVSGSCPTASYVTLSRDTVMSGVAACDQDGHWYIQTSLVPGKNTLRAQAYNRTDDPGPETTPVTVIYDPELATTASGQPAAPITDPLLLTAHFSYVAAYAGQPFSQAVTISGAQAPYALDIDWGDGSTDIYSQAEAGDVVFTHVYATSDPTDNRYAIRVTATDSQGQLAVLQLLSVITPQLAGGTVVPGSTSTSGGTGSSPIATGTASVFQKFWKIAAPTYGAALVAVSSFWLGQHREMELLRREAVRLHRRRPV